MKKIIFTLLMLCSLVANAEVYDIVPLPTSVKTTKGSYTLTETMTITSQKGNTEMQRDAQFLADYINQQTGWHWTVADKASKTNITLSLDKKILSDEAYRLTVTAKGINLAAKTPAGIFYGIQSLRKIIGAEGTKELPCTVINDTPRFSYRGVHLDCSRHFFSISFVKKYIDILALHGINKFHWHLTDDQGWRLEIKRYPELITKGSHRDQTVIGHNSPVFDERPYGGYYTQQECRDIVKYAANRYIQVIPEIDMPGHMQGALCAYPELGCTGGPYPVWQIWGVSDDVLCAGNPKTVEFLHGVLDELCDIFPSKLIHVGGDECPKTRWQKCPKCQAKIKELGIKAEPSKSAEDQLQSYLLKDAESYLAKKGRTIIGWDEVLEGGAGDNTWVMCWRSWLGTSAVQTAAKFHHNIIMTPTDFCYFDYYQTKETSGEPQAIGGYLPISKVYSLEPVSAELSEEEAQYVQGAQCNIWTEYIVSPQHAEYMLLPRLAALTEVDWMQPAAKNFDSFKNRLPRLLKLYDKLGYVYHEGIE